MSEMSRMRRIRAPEHWGREAWATTLLLPGSHTGECIRNSTNAEKQGERGRRSRSKLPWENERGCRSRIQVSGGYTEKAPGELVKGHSTLMVRSLSQCAVV